jgi:transcriptional regulator with XRE-family HTH domain
VTDGQTDLQRNLLQAMQTWNLSERGLAKKAGLGPSAVRDILHGRSREPKPETLVKLARALNLTYEELVGGSVPIPARAVSVVGAIEADAWRSTSRWPQTDWKRIPVAEDPRFPGVPVFALEVRGSIGGTDLPAGSYAVCALYEHLGGAPRTGEIVLVERRRGGLVEVTVRRFESSGDGGVLMPLSSAAEPLFPSRDPDVSVPARVLMDLRLIGGL